VAKPITDPVRLAELDELRQRHQEAAEAVPERRTGRSKTGSAVPGVEPSPAPRTGVSLRQVTELAAQLSPGERLHLVESLLAELPPAALRRLEKQRNGPGGSR
jgi:hypothetical protein